MNFDSMPKIMVAWFAFCLMAGLVFIGFIIWVIVKLLIFWGVVR